MRRFVVSRWVKIAAPLILVLLLSPAIVRAHEHRTIAGGYDVLVGWDKEPTLVDQLNAASIAVTKGGQPVTGLEKTLKVDIAFGGNTPKEFALTPSITQPGYYTVPIIPTRTGDYILRLSAPSRAIRLTSALNPGRTRLIRWTAAAICNSRRLRRMR